MLKLFFGQYLGMDFIAMALGVVSIYALGKKSRSGFLLGFGSAIAWGIVNIWARIWAGIVFDIILIALNIKGYIDWRKDIK